MRTPIGSNPWAGGKISPDAEFAKDTPALWAQDWIDGRVQTDRTIKIVHFSGRWEKKEGELRMTI